MSQEINNRERRKQAIKDTLRLLHEGKSVEEVQGIFRDAFDGVEASEISAAEQALINEGLPVAEVQRLFGLPETPVPLGADSVTTAAGPRVEKSPASRAPRQRGASNGRRRA